MLKNFLFPLFLTGAFLQADAVRVELRNPVNGTITHTTQDGVVDAFTTMSMLGRIVKGDLRDHLRQLATDQGLPATTTMDVSFMRVGGHTVLPAGQAVLPAHVGPYDGTTIAFAMVVHPSAVQEGHDHPREDVDLPATREERFIQRKDNGLCAGGTVGAVVGVVVTWGEMAIHFGFSAMAAKAYLICGVIGGIVGGATGAGCGAGCFAGTGCVTDTLYGCGRQVLAVLRRNKFLSAGEENAAGN